MMECQQVHSLESINEKCLTLKAEGFELDNKSIFTEDTKPAAKPEPGKIIKDSSPMTKTSCLQNFSLEATRVATVVLSTTKG